MSETAGGVAPEPPQSESSDPTPAEVTPPPPPPVRQPRRRALLNRLQRTARWAVEPPRPDPPRQAPPPVDTPDRPITRMSPFAIGFFGCLGAMVAYSLMMAVGQLQSILLLVIFALFLALGLNPVVELLNRRRIPRGFGVALVTLGLFAAIALATWAVVPVFTEQITNLVQNTPRYLQGLRENQQIARLDSRFQILARINDFLLSGGLLNNVFGGLLGAGKLVANALFSLIVTLVLTIYFLASLPSIKEVIYRLAPGSRRPRVRYLADEMFRRIGGYLSGMFLVVTCAGTCGFIFMTLLGLGNYALALAVMVALFAFIPLVGSSISMVLVATVAFSALSPMHGLITIAYFLIYQQFEAYIVQPRVMRRSVDVPGAVVIVVALAGGILLGVIGALIAIPSAAALLLLYREVLIPKLDRS